MASIVQPVTAEFPEKLRVLFEKQRNTVLYGGRAGTKSWGAARASLIQGVQQKLRIPCCRETQRSIADSVHKLLCDQIEELKLNEYYRIGKAVIRGCNGTEYTFHGLKHNVHEIKSLEGADLCIIEEAQAVSEASWQTLIPTIRKPGSRLWIIFNPELSSAPTYKRWVINPPPNTKVVKMSYRDNPWLSAEMLTEIEHDRLTDPEKFDHVWEGNCVSLVKGAIYGNQLRAVDAENRITRIPVDQTRPIHTAWDLGWADYVSIWLFQVFPFEYRIVDFVEGNRQDLNYYLRVLQSKNYVYGTDYMPHDARAHSLGTGKSIEELMRQAGRKVIVVPALKKADQINAVRTILPQCWFDAEKCEDGLQHLRHYKYGEQKTLGTDSREPLHDEHSHASDAFVQFAVGVKQPKKEQPKTPVRRPPVSVWS